MAVSGHRWRRHDGHPVGEFAGEQFSEDVVTTMKAAEKRDADFRLAGVVEVDGGRGGGEPEFIPQEERLGFHIH